jgi:hypothetical protein
MLQTRQRGVPGLLAVAMTAGVLVLSAAGAAGVPQQISGESAVGVLVGLDRHEGDVFGPPVASTLRTLWIPFGNAAPINARDVVEIRDLLVPRPSGFWRVGRLATCAEGPLDPDDRTRTAAAIAQYFWAAPLGRRPEVTLGPPTPLGPYPERVGPCRAKTIDCDVDRRIGLYWVAPEYVSLDLGVRGSCGAHPGWTPDYGVRRLDDVTTPLTIGALLGPTAEQAFQRAYELERARYERDMKSRGQDCGDTKFDPALWWIEREAGTWKTTGWARHERYCNYGFDFTADLDVSRIVGRPSADDRIKGQRLRARRPDLHDAHFSPAGRWAVGRTDTQLIIVDGDAAQPALTRPITRTDDIVMIEWATGRNVARWDADARRVGGRPPVNPIVVR